MNLRRLISMSLMLASIGAFQVSAQTALPAMSSFTGVEQVKLDQRLTGKIRSGIAFERQLRKQNIAISVRDNRVLVSGEHLHPGDQALLMQVIQAAVAGHPGAVQIEFQAHASAHLTSAETLVAGR